MKIAMLGSGFIARFYATSLHAQRRTDQIISVYSRNLENAKRFADDYNLSIFSDRMEDIIQHPEVEVVLISLAYHLHEMAVIAFAKAKKHVL
jgi:predicted dehydrogenase